MVTVERPKRRSDDPRDLRDRYNELCHALTQSAGTNSAAADRLLAELQSLAQQIAAAHAQAEAAQAEAPKQPPEPSGCCTYRPSNVVAFRLKVKASSSENPRLPAALSALTESYAPAPSKTAAPVPSRARTPLAALEPNPLAAPVTPVEPPSPPAAAAPSADAPTVDGPAAPPPAAPAPIASPPAATPATVSSAAAQMPADLDGMVERQGNEIEQLAQNVESAKQLLDLLEDRLAGNPSAQGLAPDVAALRSATARQGQQLVALATAVHRLAKLLAAGGPPPTR
jgi:hypothetical protein